MPKFTFERIKAVTGKAHKVLQLQIDNVKQLDYFLENLKGTQYQAEYETLISWIAYYSEGGDIGDGRLKELKGMKSKTDKFYEFRSKHLRLYAVKGDTAKIIILCGYKKDQVKDLSSLTTLHKAIFNQQKS